MAVNIPGVTVQNNGYYYKGKRIGAAPRPAGGMGGGFGGVGSGSVGNAGDDETSLKAKIAEIDEAEARAGSGQIAADLVSKQGAIADQFRKNIPTYTGLLQDQSRRGIHRDLAEKVSSLKQQSSSRGFLGGSGTTRQQAEATAGAGSEIQAKDFDIQDALEKQAQTYENQFLASRMAMEGSANQAVIDQLRQNILDTQRQNELMRSLGQTGGAIVGGYMGSKGGSNGT